MITLSSPNLMVLLTTSDAVVVMAPRRRRKCHNKLNLGKYFFQMSDCLVSNGINLASSGIPRSRQSKEAKTSSD